MRLAAGFALALTLCFATPAFADIIDPDAGMGDAGATNNTTGSTNNTTGSTTGSTNNTTGGTNNGTSGPTGGDTSSGGSKDDDGGCSVASNESAPVAPLLVGAVLLGFSRRRRRA